MYSLQGMVEGYPCRAGGGPAVLATGPIPAHILSAAEVVRCLASIGEVEFEGGLAASVAGTVMRSFLGAGGEPAVLATDLRADTLELLASSDSAYKIVE